MSLLPVFSSRSSVFSGLTFNPLIYFELIFVYDIRQWSHFIFFKYVTVSFPINIYFKECPFSIIYSYLVHHKLIGCMCMSLFLDSLFCSIDLCFCFRPILCCLITVALLYSLKSRSMLPPALLFFSQDCFGCLKSFVAPY